MNELQQVLIVFAVIVIVGLYFFSRKKPVDSTPNSEETIPVEIDTQEQEKPVQPGLVAPENQAPDNQGVLPFDEFQLEILNANDDLAEQEQLGAESTHKTLELDEMIHESQLEPLEEQKVVEPEVFAILVQTTSTESRKMADLDKIFTSLDLIYNSQQQIYVKQYLGKNVLYVANILNPGTFPAELDAEITTPGVALVTQLPAKTISSVKAVEELIWTARRISQELKGRLYDQQRKILSESDLQAMQDRAKNFENSSIDNAFR